MCRYLLLLVLAAMPAWTEDRPDDKTAAAMQSSLAKQRASIEKQRRSFSPSTFFTLPPPEPFDAPASPALDCDPLPEDQLKPIVEEEARRAGVQVELVRNVIRQESGARPCAVSVKGAQGLMQLMPATSQQLGVSDPFDPRQNVQAGAKLLKELLTRYNGDISKALAAYNAGPARVDQAGSIPNIPETIQYVSRILASLPH